MNKIKIKETLLVSSIALALSACGGNSDAPVDGKSGDENVGAYQLKNLPAQRSIEIPRSLLTKRADSDERALSRSMMMPVESDGGMGDGTEPVVSSNVPIMMSVEPDNGIGDGAGPIPIGPDRSEQAISFGYLKIKDSAFSVELSRLEQEREVLMLDAVWDDIKSRCDGAALGEACSIPENEISLKVTESLVKANDEINKRIDDLHKSQFGGFYSSGSGVAVSGGNSGVNSAAVDPQIMPEPQMVDDSLPPEGYQVMPEPQEVDGVVTYYSPEYVELPIDEPYYKEEPWIEPQPYFVAGEVIPLGEISYTQYGVDKDFQYEVEIAPSYMEPVYVTEESVDGELVEFVGSVISNERFFVVWSHDEKRVKSGFRYEDDQSSYSYTFSYLDQGDEKIVTIRDESSFDMGGEFGKGGFSSTISLSEKESDLDGTVNVSFDMSNFMPDFTMKMSSKGHANDEGGFLRTEGKFTNTYNEKTDESILNTEEIFDGKGNLLKFRWCDMACDQDENWNDGDMMMLPMPMDAPAQDFNFEESEFYMDGDELEMMESSFYEVVITVSGLEKVGEYVIVSEPISGNELPDVFANMIGGGMVDSESSDFYYWGEKGQLDTAIVYFIVLDEENFTFQSKEITGAEIIIIDHKSEPSVMMPVEPGNGIGDGAGPIPMTGMSNSEEFVVSSSVM